MMMRIIRMMDRISPPIDPHHPHPDHPIFRIIHIRINHIGISSIIEIPINRISVEIDIRII
jgi:hypothetical protein